MAGYHIKTIARGTFGEASKVREEVEEFIDACDQECKIMALVELSDLLGAIKEYLRVHFPGIEIKDLDTMSNITARAFRNGHRS
jgi:hypothetical protein